MSTVAAPGHTAAVAMVEAPDNRRPKPPNEPIWVRADADVRAIGGMISASIQQDGQVSVRAIGAGAVNQAVKGAIEARKNLAGQAFDMAFRAGYQTVKSDSGKDLSAIVLRCFLLP